MNTRKKRLLTSFCAVFVALFALGSLSAETPVPSSTNWCSYVGDCVSSCDGSECDGVGCNTECLEGICLGGWDWFVCQDSP